MTIRRTSVVAVLCLSAALPLFAQDTAEHNRRTELAKGATVIIEGCVAAGQEPDTYVLGAIKEVQAAPVAHLRKRVYWLDSTKKVKGHLGHQLRITGRVQDLERSEIELELGARPHGGAVATIEGPGNSDVSVAAATVGLGAVGTKAQSDADVPITLIKINVNKVTRLTGTCS